MAALGYYGLGQLAPTWPSLSLALGERPEATEAAPTQAPIASTVATASPSAVARIPATPSPARATATAQPTAQVAAAPTPPRTTATPRTAARPQDTTKPRVAAPPSTKVKPTPTPRAAPAKPRPARVERRYYVVQGGDSLTSVGERFGVSTQALAAANGLDADAELYVGQRMLVPTRKVHFGLMLPSVRQRLDQPAVRSLSELAPRVVGYLESRAGRTSAAVYLPEADTMYVYNPDARYVTASTVKVPIMLTQLSRQSRREARVSGSDRDLLVQMIVVGDNDAATELFRRVGGQRTIQAELRARGLTRTRIAAERWGLSTTTAPDMALLMRSLYHGERLNPGPRRTGIGLLSNVVEPQRWGVPAGLPDSAYVAFKGGWLPTQGGWQVHQLGVAEIHGRKYVFAFYTAAQPGEVYGRETLEGAARLLADTARER